MRETGEVEIVIVRDSTALEQELDQAAVARPAVRARDRAAQRGPARPRARDLGGVGAGVEQCACDVEESLRSGGLELVPAGGAGGVEGGPAGTPVGTCRQLRVAL